MSRACARLQILVSLVLMPVWYFTVSVLIAVWGGQSWRDTVLIIFSLPFFSYACLIGLFCVCACVRVFVVVAS